MISPLNGPEQTIVFVCVFFGWFIGWLLGCLVWVAYIFELHAHFLPNLAVLYYETLFKESKAFDV